MKKHLCLIFVLVLCGSFSSFAKTTLSDAFDDALQYDPVFKAEAAKLESIKTLVPQAFAKNLIDIKGTGAVAYNKQISSVSPFTNNTGAESFLNLTASQPIFNMAGWKSISSAKASVKAAQASFSAAYQDLMVRVTSIYFAHLEAEDFLEFAKAEKIANDKQLEKAKERFEVGLDPITSVHEAQAAYDIAKSQEIAAKNTLDNQLENLYKLTGQRYSSLRKLKHNFPIFAPNPRDPEDWANKAISQNYELQAIKYQLEEARHFLGAQRAEHLPTVAATASYDYAKRNYGSGSNSTNGNLQGLFSGGNDQSAKVGINLNVPIFQSGLTYAKTKQAAYSHENVKNLHRAKQLDIANQTKQTINNILSDISQIRANKEALKSAQSAYESNKEAVNVGTRTTVELLIAQKEVFRAKRNLSSKHYSFINNSIKLKLLTATLTPDEITIISKWLN